jgi:hypothetical protein
MMQHASGPYVNSSIALVGFVPGFAVFGPDGVLLMPGVDVGVYLSCGGLAGFEGFDGVGLDFLDALEDVEDLDFML